MAKFSYLLQYLRTLIFVLCGLIICSSFAQVNYNIEHISFDKGLPQNSIGSGIVRDSLGFIWIGSWGLHKYDGYSFKSQYHNPADSNSLNNNKILRLFSDNRKQIWISYSGGLDRYQYSKDDFKHYYFINENGDTIPSELYALQQNTAGTFYAGINFAPDSLYKQDMLKTFHKFERVGVYTFDPASGKFTPVEFINKVLNTGFVKHKLKKTAERGIYETEITFSSGYLDHWLHYKFAIVRKDKSRYYEFNVNAPRYAEARSVKLDHNYMVLPGANFNQRSADSNISIVAQRDFEKNIQVKFSVDVNRLKTPIQEGESIEITGDIFPLSWEPRFSINDLKFDTQNRIWIALQNFGVFRFDLANKTWKHFYYTEKDANSLSSDLARNIFIDSDGDIWIITNRGLDKFRSAQQNFKRYTDSYVLFDYKVSNVAEYPKGILWISYFGSNVLTRFDKSNHSIVHIEKLPHGSASMYIDPSGIIWLGSQNRGITKINVNPPKFNRDDILTKNIDLFKNKDIYSILEDKENNIWIGGAINGLYKYNRKTGRHTYFKYHRDIPDSLGTANIEAIHQTKDGYIWLCGLGGINRYDLLNNRFKRFTSPVQRDKNSLRGAKFIGLCEAKGTLWAISSNGYLNRYNPGSESFASYYVGNDKILLDIINDREGNIWMISEFGGLHKFDPLTKEFETIVESFNGRTLLIDSTGIIWFNGIHGLMSYDPKSYIKKIISTKDGMLSNLITAMELDNSGNIWLSSKRGITKYNPVKGTFKHYFKEDGFRTNNFCFNANTRTGNGEIIFGSRNGIAMFHPDSIKDSEFIAPIVLTDLRINNTLIDSGRDPLLGQSFFTAEKLKLDYSQNDIALTFAALDYTLPQRNKYTYILENYEEHWRSAGLERTAHYTNLDPGEYIFKVKGSNSDGVWNDTPRVLQITILPPWWKTYWAYTFYFFAFIALFLGIRRYELSRQQLKHDMEMEHVEAEKLKEVDNLKSRFFASISHEFRTPLTLIRGPVERLLKQIRDKKQISDLKRIEDNAVRMNKLVEMYLDLSRLESGNLQLQKEECDIIPLLKSVTASFESMAQASAINLKFSTTIFSAIGLVDKEKFEMIWINLLSNALKFTPQNGEIITLVKTLKNSKMLEISVSDTGIGITDESLSHIFDMYYQMENEINRHISGTGIGLTMVKELVEMHNGQICVESEVSAGTTFTITIPFISYSEIAEEFETMPAHISKEPLESEYNDIPGKKQQDRQHILIVEDNHQMQDYIKSHLEDDYQIELAANGKEGFISAVKSNPTLIISDVMMPEMDGYEFCTKIKNDLRTSHIPVILLTAKAGKKDKLNGLQTGVDDYLLKPFDAQELMARIKNLIEQRERLHENFQKNVTIQPADVAVSSMDQSFLKKAIELIEINMGNSQFNTAGFGKEIGFSRGHLNAKLKALTGMATHEFIRNIRLKRAAQLLEKDAATVSEIAYQVGFNSLSHFSKVFKETYTISPSDYNSND